MAKEAVTLLLFESEDEAVQVLMFVPFPEYDKDLAYEKASGCFRRDECYMSSSDNIKLNRSVLGARAAMYRPYVG